MRLKLLLLAMLLAVPTAFAGTYSLNDWCFYVNSLDVNRSCANGSGVDNFNPPATVGTFEILHLSNESTLAKLGVTLGPGTYRILALFNYDIEDNGSGGQQSQGGTNEYAATFGKLELNQMYSVGTYQQPDGTPSALYTQFAAGSLDNENHYPACPGAACPDLAVALGYNDLTVPEGMKALVTFTAGTEAPSGDTFYVQQKDSAIPDSIVFSSSVDMYRNPEPSTVLLMCGGLGVMAAALRRRRKA